MKKTISIAVLTAGSAAACAAGGLFCLTLFGFLMQAMVIPCLIILGGHVTGAVFLQKHFRKYGLNGIRFWLCTGLPGIIAGGAALIITNMLDNAGYFTGFMPGLGEFLFSLSFFAYSAAYLAAVGITLMTKHLISSKKHKEKP